MDWSEGYVTDIGYTRGYYRELGPGLQSFALAATGHEPPDQYAPFNKVELGCGYGLSLLMEAAAYPHAQFYGVDFNPDHITWAKRIAALARLDNVHFFEMSFADLIGSDIPDADYVGLHGVWSWVSDENRDVITRFLDRRLKSGGVVMVSYNVLPGWSANRSLRELMMRKYRSVAGPTQDRIEEALKFASEFRAAGALLFAQNPGLSDHLDAISKMSKRYLAHEYFNQDWHLFYQYQVAEKLASARLSFLSACKPGENIDRMNFTPTTLKLIEQVAGPERETLKDIHLNRTFRYDLYGRGIEKMGLFGTVGHILNSNFVLIDKPAKFEDGNVKTPLGNVKLKRELFEPILKRLMAGPANGQEFTLQPGSRPLAPAEVVEVLSLMIDVGAVGTALPNDGLEERTLRTRRLNDAFISRTMKGEDISFLVSPVSGLGHNVANYFQHFWAAEASNKDPVAHAWKSLKLMNKRMLKSGVMIEGDQENLKELQVRYQEYEQDWKPRWKQLRIIN